MGNLFRIKLPLFLCGEVHTVMSSAELEVLMGEDDEGGAPVFRVRTAGTCPPTVSSLLPKPLSKVREASSESTGLDHLSCTVVFIHGCWMEDIRTKTAGGGQGCVLVWTLVLLITLCQTVSTQHTK